MFFVWNKKQQTLHTNTGKTLLNAELVKLWNELKAKRSIEGQMNVKK
jgi:hypothetical protein